MGGVPFCSMGPRTPLAHGFGSPLSAGHSAGLVGFLPSSSPPLPSPPMVMLLLLPGVQHSQSPRITKAAQVTAGSPAQPPSSGKEEELMAA